MDYAVTTRELGREVRQPRVVRVHLPGTGVFVGEQVLGC